MDIGTSFIPNTESSELVQPAVGAFDDPTNLTQAAPMRSSSFRNVRPDPATSQFSSMRFGVIGPIGVQFLRTTARFSRFPCHRWNRIHQRKQLGHVVAIRRSHSGCERDTVAVGRHVVFRSRFPAIRGIRTGLRPPKTARTDVESITARDQSIWSASRKYASKTRWISSQTPIACQAASRRQQVIPDPHPISWGKSSHAIPDLSTNRIPVNTARLSSGLRPGFRLRRGLGGGSNGPMIAHSLSSKIGLAMVVPPCTAANLRQVETFD